MIYFTVPNSKGEPIGWSQPRVSERFEWTSSFLTELWRPNYHYSPAFSLPGSVAPVRVCDG